MPAIINNWKNQYAQEKNFIGVLVIIIHIEHSDIYPNSV